MKKLTSLYLFALMVLFPLWFSSGGYGSIEQAKYTFLMAATGALLLLSAAVPLEMRLAGGKRGFFSGGSGGRSPARGCALGLLAAVILSAAFSGRPQIVWLGAGRYDGVLTRAVYVLIFLLAARYGGAGKLHFYALGAALAAMGLLITLQFFGRNPLGLYPAGLCFHDRYTAYGGEFLGTIGNSDLLSAFLCAAVPLLLGCAMLRERGGPFLLAAGCLGWWGLLLSEVTGGRAAIPAALLLSLPLAVRTRGRFARYLDSCAALSLTAAVYSLITYAWENRRLTVRLRFGGRTAVLLAAAAGLFLLALLVRRLKCPVPGEKSRRLLAALLVAALLLGAAAYLYFAGAGLSGTAGELSRVLHGDLENSFGSNRVAIWREVWRLIRERPILGGGPDTLGARSALVFSRALKSGAVVTASVDSAHNDFLGLWVNTGLLSLLAYLGVLGFTLVPAARANTDEAFLYFLPALAYLLQSLAGIDECVAAPVFWCILGLLQHSITNKPKEKKP